MPRFTRYLGDVIRALPGVRPRLAATVLTDALERAQHEAAAHEPPVDPARQLFERLTGPYGDFLALTPAGVRVVLGRYAAGELPMQRGTAPVDPPADLARFAALVTPDDFATEDRRLDALEADQPLTFALLDVAYWRWVERACPHARGTPAAAEWRRATSFEYRGVRYERERRDMPSNSGKTVRRWTEYHGADGSVLSDGPLRLNRRNDPDRNWGLGRE